MADMGNDFHIKVSTEDLRTKADAVSGLLEELRGECEELYGRISRTASYWEGDGGTKRRSEYEKKQKLVERMLKRLKEYPEDLLKMAGIYEIAEAEATEQMDPLASDVIV